MADAGSVRFSASRITPGFRDGLKTIIGSDTDGEIQRAMRAGAAANLLKSMPNDRIVSVIRSVHAGRRDVPAEVRAIAPHHHDLRSLAARLQETSVSEDDGLPARPAMDATFMMPPPPR